MDFDLNDEQQMLRDGAERFLLDSYSFEERKHSLAAPAACRAERWQSFADLGWLALTIPEDLGGLGAGQFESTLIAEAMGRRAVVEPFAMTAILTSALLSAGGSNASRETLLAEVAAGSRRFSLAIFEPDTHYRFLDADTTAQRTTAGFRICGVKQLCFDAPAADTMLVTATLEGQLALFLVDSRATGLRHRTYPTIDGRYAADLDLDDVEVDTQALLGFGPALCASLDDALDRLRIFEVAEALGAMERIMELTADHLRNRKQFGQPLAAFQALQHRMAEMFVEVQETRSALYHALAHFEDAPPERRAAVSSAKVVAIEAGRVVGGLGIQLHGGVGMTNEYEVGHHYRRLLVLERAWGDLDFHLDRIAARYS